MKERKCGEEIQKNKQIKNKFILTESDYLSILPRRTLVVFGQLTHQAFSRDLQSIMSAITSSTFLTMRKLTGSGFKFVDF
jgi:hypothetical protein